ncbi:MAG TPA: hypothetical protein VM537_13830 [Anaerolineae bacterium]|nr:hypothetical protein [Anaerolineae bacterium]
MPCEDLNNDDLVDRLVAVVLELDRLNALKAHVHDGVLQDLGQAPDVDRGVDIEYVEAIGRRAGLDKLHVHSSREIITRGLHDDYLKALDDARKRKQSL